VIEPAPGVAPAVCTCADCKVPFTVTEPLDEVVMATPGSSTSTRRPKASVRLLRCLPAWSVVVTVGKLE
jgi:hypothetical protein